MQVAKPIHFQMPQKHLTASFLAGTLSLLSTAAFAIPAQAEAGHYERYKSPEITVYNQNFALIKDYRTIPLKQGDNSILMDDVAGLVDPTSVLFKSVSAPHKVTVKEQNFKYDLISRTAILDRLVGKTIRFRKDGVIKEGILMNPPTTYARDASYGYNTYHSGYGRNNISPSTTSDFAIKTPEGILLTSLGDIIVDEIPEGLYPRPTLAWNIWSGQAGSHQTEIAYLSDGVNWNCDYVAQISSNDTSIDLQSWVTLKNFSAATFPNAHLKLVAGDVNRVSDGGPAGNVFGDMRSKAAAMEAESSGGFKEEGLFEYHLYTLQGTTTLTNNEIKQLSLVSASNIPVQKRFIFDPDRSNYQKWLYQGWNDGYYGTYNYYANKPGTGAGTDTYKKVNVMVRFKNSEANHLGIPLPKGKIRVNKADSSGSVQFIGEDWMDHTPKDEWVDLYLGDAFDVVAEKKNTHYVREKDYVEETFQVSLRNHKKEAVTVEVLEHVFRDWTLVSSNAQSSYEKTDANTARFKIGMAPDQEQTLTYTVRINRK
ncbi:MAG: hypothetical protein K2X66_00550 [Cyanobacteria bacterium]|nr:hypothetical protein [Cyanobacteriota bacterium]